MQNRPWIGVAVIIIRDGRVLLGKRKGAHGAGAWALPGGHLEMNESIEACARREVLEETGLSIRNIRHAAFTNDIFEDAGKHYVTLFVTADYSGGEPRVREPDKCEKWEWFVWGAFPDGLFLSLKNLLAQGFSLRDDPQPPPGQKPSNTRLVDIGERAFNEGRKD